MSTRSTRRSFLQKSIAGAAAVTALAQGPVVLAKPAPKAKPAKEKKPTVKGPKLRMAVIGPNGMGRYSVESALEEELVAICDVDDNSLKQVMEKSVKDAAKPKLFYDYRKMLDEMHDQIDVVLIATPDHHHGPAAIRAINYGKHVFCQKPLGHNIAECYMLAKAAREKKVLTQMGNQGYCGEPIRRVSEYIAAGAIGTVTETHTILERNFGGTGGRPASKPVPAGLHWDEWIGPAPYRDFHDGLHPFHWRDWKAFGTGTIGDMSCHRLAFPFMALRLWEVKQYTIECLNTKNGSEEKYPQDNVVCYHIPARKDFPACKCYVYDHQALRPEVMKELEKKHQAKWSAECTLFVGTKGYLNNHSRIIPETEHQKVPVPAKTLPRPKGSGPIRDLCACIREGGAPASNFIDAAASLTSMALTGHLAQYAGIGGKVEWDAEKMQCTNKPELNQYVRREYRRGWEVV